MSCYTKASAKGALDGPKKCQFAEGDLNSPATSSWVALDGKGPEGVPQCLPPIIIKVDDARTKEPLRGVTIIISVPYASGISSVRRPIETLYTDKSKRSDLAVEFSTEQRDIFIEIKKDKYTSISRNLDRGKNCKDATKCEFHFALSEVLEGGAVSPQGCFFVGKPEKAEWDMRAVLEWGKEPADLDIWARNYGCYSGVESDYECTGKKPQETERGYGYRWRTICKRRLFRQRYVRDQEKEACGTQFCTQDQQKTAFFYNKKPKCTNWNQAAYNQFDKWVFWDVRYAHKMSRRCTRTGINIEKPKVNCDRWARGAKNWNDNHYMVLDVDEQNGNGPETISFKNVPPGVYQVVVNQWTTTSRKKVIGGKVATIEDVAYGNPRVNIYISNDGKDIRFECLIPDSCLSQVRIWNVVNIKVRDAGPYEQSTTGEHKYEIRLVDDKDGIIPLRWVEMPTRRDGKQKEWTENDLHNQPYWLKGTATEYLDGYLSQACVGQCHVAPENAEYKDCLARTHTEKLATNLTSH